MKSIILFAIVLVMASCHTTNKKILIPTSKYNASQELTIPMDTMVDLVGRLEYANNRKLVIFIAGSGPTDMDCNNAAGLKTDAFKMLAEFLQSREISSFRFDKRGIGKSSKVQEGDLTFYSFVNDVDSLASYFADDFDKIILLGHSEGAIIGSLVSQSNTAVRSYISVAGPSKRMDEIIIEQIEKYPKLVPLVEGHIAEIMSGGPLSEVNPMLRSLFRPSVVPFLKSVFEISPVAEIAKITKPILIVSGRCDLQVPIENATALHEVCPNSQLVIIDNMGHVMKELGTDCNLGREAYSDPTMPLNKEFENAVYQFVSNQ